MDVRRTLFAGFIALCIGITAVVVLQGGFSSDPGIRFVETAAVVIVAGAALFGAMAFIGVHMAGWEEPESEAEFDAIVERSERLAREGLAADPLESEFM